MAGLDLLILCGPEANQRALAHKLAEGSSTIGIVVVRHGSGGKPQPMLHRLARGLAGFPLRRAWFGMLDHFERRFPSFPKSPLLEVTDVNDPAVAELAKRLRPRLTVVSGTNLLKAPLIESLARSGPVMNLHTGISPFVKGGPNCTNWCLATGNFHLIGNSVMWIDAGIDSGNLVATGQTPLDGREGLTGLHVKVMKHAHDLLRRCVRRFLNGEELPNVAQTEIGAGRLYLTKQLNAAQAARAVANFYLRYSPRPLSKAPPRLVGG